MKIGKLFLAGIIALGLGLTACNNDTPEIQKKGGILTVKVIPTSEPGGTRITGDLTDPGVTGTGLAAESTVFNYEVWVFNTTNGNLEKYQKFDGNGVGQVTGLTVGPKEIVVVANGNIGTQPNKDALLAQTKMLSQEIGTGMVMTMQPTTMTLDPCNEEHTDCNTLDAEVKRVNARVAVVAVSTSFAADAPYKSFELTEVAMFNVRQTSNIFDPMLNEGSKFLFGSAYPSPESSYVEASEGGILEPTLADATANLPLNVTTTPLNVANSKYFYVFENDATAGQETFVVLKGKLYDENGEVYELPGVYTDPDGFTYYKVYVNGADYTYTGDDVAHDGTVIRNTQYNITIALTKAGNPTIDEPAEACLDVTVTVAPWTVVNQSVTW